MRVFSAHCDSSFGKLARDLGRSKWGGNTVPEFLFNSVVPECFQFLFF